MNIGRALRLLEQEYQTAKKLSYVRDPVAYALYAVWRTADKERQKKEVRENDR